MWNSEVGMGRISFAHYVAILREFCALLVSFRDLLRRLDFMLDTVLDIVVVVVVVVVMFAGCYLFLLLSLFLPSLVACRFCFSCCCCCCCYCYCYCCCCYCCCCYCCYWCYVVIVLLVLCLCVNVLPKRQVYVRISAINVFNYKLTPDKKYKN